MGTVLAMSKRFKKDYYCIPPRFEKSAKFWRYAIAVLLKNASTLRVLYSLHRASTTVVCPLVHTSVFLHIIALPVQVACAPRCDTSDSTFYYITGIIIPS